MKVNTLILILLVVFSICNTFGQERIDTVSFENGALNMEQSNLQSHRYLVYFQDTVVNSPLYNVSIWDRKIVDQGGTYQFQWLWTATDSASYSYKTVDLNRNYRPINMRWSSYENGKLMGKLALNFEEKALISDQDTLLHKYQEIKIPYDYVPFCWDIDMETFGLLPQHLGKTYAIPFYDVGGSPPAYYTYTFDRKENIHVLGQEFETIVLRHYHPTDNSEYTEWWITTDTFEVVRMKSRYGDKYRFKELIVHTE